MNHSPILARAIQFALRPHLFGGTIDRAQIANALAHVAPPVENPMVERFERNAPEGWRITEKARERVMRLTAAPGRAARRRLLAQFRADPSATFEPDVLYFAKEDADRAGVVTIDELRAAKARLYMENDPS